MKMIGFAFVCIMIKLLFDGHHNDIIGPKQVCLALICLFYCGMFFGECVLLLRQRVYFLGDTETVLKKYDEFSTNDKCE